MRDADTILHVKTGQLHADVLIADVIIKNSILGSECAMTYIQISHVL